MSETPEEVSAAVEVEKSGQTYKKGFFTDEKGNLKFVNLMVKFPITIFIVILIITLFLTRMLTQTVFKRGNPFTDTSTPSYDINDVRSIAMDSFKLATEEVAELRKLQERNTSESNSSGLRFQEELSDITYWAYESDKPEGVFGSEESIAAMFETLSIFTKNEDYEKYCFKEYESDSSEGKCRPTFSALSMYYASEWDSELVQTVIDQLKVPENVLRYNILGVCIEFGLFCNFIPERYDNDEDKGWAIAFNANITKIISTWDGEGELIEDFHEGTEFAAYMKKLNTKRGIVEFGYDENFSTDNLISMYSRAFLSWGEPLDRSQITIVPENPELKPENLTDADVLGQWISKNFLTRMVEISDEDYSSEINSYYFMPSLILDVLLRIVTRDGMLALFSFAFVFTYIRAMVGSWFLALVGITEIFLSIPVSWFFFDQVFQVRYFSFLNVLCLFIVAAIGADDIFIFMDAYKQSAFQDASVLESFESRMSWVYRRTGSAMAITSATTCSAFLCTLLTPLVSVQAFGIFAAIVIFVDYVLVMSLFCSATIIYHNKFEKDGFCCAPTCCYGGFCKTSDPTPTMRAYDQATAVNGDPPTGDKISVFFRSKIAVFLTKPLNRYIIFTLYFTWVIVAVIFGARLEPTTETEEFLDENHPLQKTFTIIGNNFPSTEQDLGSKIYFSWGVGEVDRNGVNQLLDPAFLGKPTYIESFEFNEQCQTEMLRTCDELKTSDDYKSNIKQEAGLGVVHCFVEEFGAYSVYGNLNDCQAVKRGSWKNETWQVSPEDFAEVMEGFLNETSCYSDRREETLLHYKDEIGWNGSSLIYASVAAESAVVDPFSTLAEQVTRNEYDKFIEIGEGLDQIMIEACGSSVTMTDLDFNFVFMNTQRIYVRAAIQSACLGLGIAFTVLLIATRVFHIALFATFNILCVLASIVGSIVMLGWSLGSIESILISITAGFAVDYVVHLAHAYERAKGDTYERIATAFGEMGISVLSGMVTSVGASIPLFFCQLQFFKKFGTFICLTIAFSWIFANFFFMSILSQAKVKINNKKCLNL